MIDEEVCLLRSKIASYKTKKVRTVRNIAEMLTICKSPYVAFSCGKDSSVLADMVLRQNPNIPLRFISSGETRILHNVDDVINYFREKYGANVEEIVFDRVFSEEWQSATFDEQRKAGRRDIQNIDNTMYDGVFMGLRSEESRGRQISLACCRTEGLPSNMYKYANRDFYRMCPLKDWRVEDIGAYIVENQIPTLNWYKVNGFGARTTARLTGDSIRQNTLSYIKMQNAAGFRRLVERFPELNIYG